MTGIEPSMKQVNGLVIFMLIIVFMLFFVFSYLGFKSRGANIAGNIYLNQTIDIRLLSLLLIISFLALCGNIYLAVSSHGTLALYFLSANMIYSDRVGGDGSVFHQIPYLTYLAYICLCFACSNKQGKYNISIIVYSAIILTIDGAFMFGRASILMTLIAMSAPMFLALYHAKFLKKLKLSILGVAFLALILFATNQLRSARGGMENYNVPNNPIIEFLLDVGIYTPSMYVYASAPIVVLNENVMNDVSTKAAIPFENSIAPVPRLFLRPFDIDISHYEESVDIGFRDSNTGGYLKDFYRDFGVFGVALSTAIIAFLFGGLFKTAIHHQSQIAVAKFAVMLPLIFMGPIINYLRTPYFLIGLMGVFFIGYLNSALSKRNNNLI
jgi:hypothetical protein